MTYYVWVMTVDRSSNGAKGTGNWHPASPTAGVLATSVGDVANTASRLETFEKEAFLEEPEEVCWRVLVGDPTWSRLEGRFTGETRRELSGRTYCRQHERRPDCNTFGLA